MFHRRRVASAFAALVGSSFLLWACGGAGDTTTVTVTAGAEEETSEAASSQTPAPTGSVGDVLTLSDNYDESGVEKVQVLDIRLVEVSDAAHPNPSSKYAFVKPPAGYSYLRLQVEITQTGDTETGNLLPEMFSAVDSQGQQFEAATGDIFNPSLFSVNGGGLSLPPEESRLGYVAIPIPEDSKISKIVASDAGYVPPDTATWSVD